MSFGISIGDIILCTQLAHHLITSFTNGRRNAAQDIRELEEALFGLHCALKILQSKHGSITADGVEANQYFGKMITSCQETLHELDNATAKYRHAGHAGHAAPWSFGAQIRVQWRRVLWSLRGDELCKYRVKLQMHTESINLVLGSFVWAATSRIEDGKRIQERRMDELLSKVSRFNEDFERSMKSLQMSVDSAQMCRSFGSRVPMSLHG